MAKINLKYISFHANMLENRNMKSILHTYGYEGFYVYFNLVVYMANNDGFYSLYDDVLLDDLRKKTRSLKVIEIINALLEVGIIQAIYGENKVIRILYDITLYENTLRLIKLHN